MYHNMFIPAVEQRKMGGILMKATDDWELLPPLAFPPDLPPVILSGFW